MKITTAIICSCFIATIAQAAVSINVITNDGAGKFFAPGDVSLNSGYVYAFGTFDVESFNALSDAQKKDFSVVSPLMATNAQQQTNFDDNGNIFSLPVGSYVLPMEGGATTGDQLYALVYQAADSAFWGLFTATPTSSSWAIPGDPGPTTLSNAVFGASGTALVGSLSGNNATLIANQPIPEPSTYALLAGVMTLGLVAYRRRQKA